MTMPSSVGRDQAHLPAFKATLVGQAAAGLVFGLAPLLIQGAYASALGFSGDDVLVYRLGGAATTGYFVAALIALVRPTDWVQLRIPAIATTGASHPPPPVATATQALIAPRTLNVIAARFWIRMSR